MPTEKENYLAYPSLSALLERKLLTTGQVLLAKRLGVTQFWVSYHLRKKTPTRLQVKVLKKVAPKLGLSQMELALLCAQKHKEIT